MDITLRLSGFIRNMVLNYFLKFIAIVVFLVPSYSYALELNVSKHLASLGGSLQEHRISGVSKEDFETIQLLMSKNFISNWNDENINLKIGLSANSLFVLVNNKTDRHVQYKLQVEDENNNKIGFKQSQWFDLLPKENSHLGGTPLFFKNDVYPNVLNLRIFSQNKKFASDVEMNFSSLINSRGKDSDKVMGDRLYEKTVIFPKYEIYRSDPTKKKMNDDLKIIDSILSNVGVSRNKIGLKDVREHYGLEYKDTRIMGIYDDNKKKVIVTTGSSIPNTTMIKFNHASQPGVDYYYYSEHVTDYAGELVGAAYTLLFKKLEDKSEILFERQSLGYVQLIHIANLVAFPNNTDVFIIASENNGVQHSNVAAKLIDNKLVNKIYFNVAYEGGHGDCPEDPFNVCG